MDWKKEMLLDEGKKIQGKISQKSRFSSRGKVAPSRFRCPTFFSVLLSLPNFFFFSFFPFVFLFLSFFFASKTLILNTRRLEGFNYLITLEKWLNHQPRETFGFSPTTYFFRFSSFIFLVWSFFLSVFSSFWWIMESKRLNVNKDHTLLCRKTTAAMISELLPL